MSTAIDDLRKTPAFREAYGRLDQGKRLAVDHGLIKASMGMQGFLNRANTVLWSALSPDDAQALDTAVRTQLALGVFRATFANSYTRDSIPVTSAVDEAARVTDVRAAALVLGRIARQNPGLRDVDPSAPAAFHQVLDGLTRSHGMSALRLGSIASDAALAVDVAIDALFERPSLLDDQLRGIRQGAVDAIQDHAAAKNLPVVWAAAIWVLAMRQRASMFGEEERTQAYADFDEATYF